MSMAFLKKGKEAGEAFDQAEAKAAAASAAAKAASEGDGKSGEFLYKFRYWMPQEAENMITFLDGDLNENGVLDEVCYEEHQLQIGGDWKNFFPCTSDTEPCPLCTAGQKKAFIAVFTVIDHSEWTDKNGVIHKNEIRLYAVKRDTLKLLRKQAVKRGGLKGCTYEVGRTGDKSAAVGSDFDFVTKADSMDKIAKEYEVDITPLNYEDVIQYKTAAELTELGLGTPTTGIGSEPTGEAPDLSQSL